MLTTKLTMQDMCDRLRVHRHHIYKMVEAGKLPEPFRLGDRILWDEDEVVEALERLRAK